MRSIITLTIFLVLLNNKLAFAQRAKIVDTVYYLVDTANTPKNDQMIEMGIEGRWHYYLIRCNCLKYSRSPVFAYDVKDQQGESITKKDFKKINLISLPNLIELARDGEGINAFNYKHVAYFLEPNEENYVKRKVVQLRPPNPAVVY